MSETYFQKWYSNNKGKFNASRKSRYHSDPEYREQAIARAREYRATRRREAPETHEPKIIMHNGHEVRVFRIGAVASMIGASTGFIRKMEAMGVIPIPTVESAHRFYTEAQVSLLRDLVQELFKHPINSAARAQALEEQRAIINHNW